MTPPTVEKYGTPTLSIEEVFPAKNNNNDDILFPAQNNSDDVIIFPAKTNDEEQFQADSSFKKTWSAFEHFPINTRINEKENLLIPANENQLIPSAGSELILSSDSEETTTLSPVTSNSTSVSTSVYVVLNTR